MHAPVSFQRFAQSLAQRGLGAGCTGAWASAFGVRWQDAADARRGVDSVGVRHDEHRSQKWCSPVTMAAHGKDRSCPLDATSGGFSPETCQRSSRFPRRTAASSPTRAAGSTSVRHGLVRREFRVAPSGDRESHRTLQRADYVYPGYSYAGWTGLARLLASLAPRPLTTCFRATGGSEAVDLALQAAMIHTGRPHCCRSKAATTGIRSPG